jgi:GT2 family glycosyltransferase
MDDRNSSAKPSPVAEVLDVVIVAYRSRELVRDCLESLHEHAPALPMRVFVIDNASNDGTAEMVHERFPEVELEASSENLGFSAANNRAIRRSAGAYVLALNPDTRITAGALDTLLEVMVNHPEVGICGCRLVQANGALDHACRRSFPTVLGALGHFSGVGRHRDRGHLAQYHAPDVERGPVDAVNGAFMLMRREALDNVGLFDEGFWMYGEDLDLCYRFGKAEWVTWYEPTVTVLHLKGATAGKLRRPRLNYAFHYGMFRFYRKHYATENNVVVNILVYGGIGVKFAGSIVKNESLRLMRTLRPAMTPHTDP